MNGCTGRARFLAGLTIAAALPLFLLSLTPVFAQQQSATPLAPTEHDIYEELGRRVPAFGGMFVDEDTDTLFVYLVPGMSGTAPQMDHAISEVFGSARPPEHLFVVLEGQYSYLQLKNWMDLISANLFEIPSVRRLGVNQARNQITVDVETMDVSSQLTGLTQQFGLPAQAVAIEVASLPAPEDGILDEAAAVESKTLQDRWRPAVGGLKIQIKEENASSKSNCTLGFAATRGKIAGFVTAGHCVENQQTVKDAMAYQPAYVQADDDNFIGGGPDSYFPKYFEGKRGDFTCPQRRICRLSDSVFIELFVRGDAAMGAIAQTAVGKIDWDGKAKYRIVGKQASSNFVTGQQVLMVGQKSGLLQGKVSGTCESLPIKDSNETYLCQAVVDWQGAGPVSGDSGGPVFVIKDGTDVILYGVVATGGGVSRIDWTQDPTELGPLAVCANGFVC